MEQVTQSSDTTPTRLRRPRALRNLKKFTEWTSFVLTLVLVTLFWLVAYMAIKLCSLAVEILRLGIVLFRSTARTSVVYALFRIVKRRMDLHAAFEVGVDSDHYREERDALPINLFCDFIVLVLSISYPYLERGFLLGEYLSYLDGIQSVGRELKSGVNGGTCLGLRTLPNVKYYLDVFRCHLPGFRCIIFTGPKWTSGLMESGFNQSPPASLVLDGRLRSFACALETMPVVFCSLVAFHLELLADILDELAVRKPLRIIRGEYSQNPAVQFDEEGSSRIDEIELTEVVVVDETFSDDVPTMEVIPIANAVETSSEDQNEVCCLEQPACSRPSFSNLTLSKVSLGGEV